METKILTEVLFILSLIIGIGFAQAHGEEDFSRAEEMIKNKISCEELSDDELEILGDYYMEQMHPGETHEAMDEMMGGEGSESLRAIHINMGKSFYCGEYETMPGGMMNMMMGGGMMSRGMMGGENMMNQFNDRNNLFSSGAWLFNWLFNILIIVMLVLFIILLIKKIQKNKKWQRKRK